MDLPQILGTDRVLFFNDSRVLPARIPLKSNNIIRRDGTYGSIANGEILFCQNLP